mgnify:CR=1 FL=1
MIEINSVELKKEIEVLNNLINSYEETQLNLFNQLKDATINWQDGNSVEFENKIYLEKQEADLVLQSLNDKRDILIFIYDKYSDLGKKVRCNLNNKATIIHALENCYNQANSIINEFNKIDRSFYYSEINKIDVVKQKVLNTKIKLDNTKSIVSKIYNQIEEIEKEIKNKIVELEEIKINEFEFNLI